MTLSLLNYVDLLKLNYPSKNHLTRTTLVKIRTANERFASNILAYTKYIKTKEMTQFDLALAASTNVNCAPDNSSD